MYVKFQGAKRYEDIKHSFTTKQNKQTHTHTQNPNKQNNNNNNNNKTKTERACLQEVYKLQLRKQKTTLHKNPFKIYSQDKYILDFLTAMIQTKLLTQQAQVWYTDRQWHTSFYVWRRLGGGDAAELVEKAEFLAVRLASSM